MKRDFNVWKSPRMWLKNAAILAAVWVVAFLFTKSAGTATIVAAIYFLVGLAGFFSRDPYPFTGSGVRDYLFSERDLDHGD
jgi:hypothetical protein